MTELTTTNWYAESGPTQSYVAQPGRGCSVEINNYIHDAGEAFKVATDTYLGSHHGAALTTEGLDMAQPSGWLGFAGRIATGYTRAHFELINEDQAYCEQIGSVMDQHASLWPSNHVAPRTARQRIKRIQQDGHEMVKNAIEEGIYTIMAVYPMVPARAAIQFPDADMSDLQQLSLQTLASATAIAQRLARHSKQGNEVFIKKVAVSSSYNISPAKIAYKRLRFYPDRFRIDQALQEPILTVNRDAHYLGDTKTYFTGCPALAGGSIGYLNRTITNRIKEENCYQRTLAGLSERQTGVLV